MESFSLGKSSPNRLHVRMQTHFHKTDGTGHGQRNAASHNGSSATVQS